MTLKSDDCGDDDGDTLDHQHYVVIGHEYVMMEEDLYFDSYYYLDDYYYCYYNYYCYKYDLSD